MHRHGRSTDTIDFFPALLKWNMLSLWKTNSSKIVAFLPCLSFGPNEMSEQDASCHECGKT